ncbi:MAG: hypothetical protein GWN16_12500, partial [Calditrichae bacterium]|nr:hypothetical protein [Calditrichia bacterium]
IIGEYSKGEEGPTVIFMAGVHGNERASIIALNSVFSQLNQLSPHFKGKLVGIAGNLAALSKSIRYVEEDLNRIWSVPRIQNLLAPIQPFQNGETVEKFEQKDLVRTLQSYCQNKDAPVYVIDLHTTSATSPPFVIILDTLRNRHFALKFPLPIVLGMEEHLDGTLINYLDQFGFITMAIEAGQHEQQSSIQNHIAAIWLALIHAGCIALEEIPQFTYYQTKLRSETEHLPRVFEVVYRYPITNGERFRME